MPRNLPLRKLIAVMVIGLALEAPVAFAKVEPLPEKATLEWNGKTMIPDSVTEQAIQEYQVSNQTLMISNATIISVGTPTTNVLWTAVCSNADCLRWIGADSTTAYLQGFQKDGAEFKPDKIPRVLRLELTSGNFLPAFSLPLGNKLESILEAALHGNTLVILSANLVESKFTRYRVTCFDTVKGKQIWSKSFEAAPDDPPAGAFLLSAVRPNEALSSVQNLSWIGNDILVCAGPKQSFLCLKKDTGKKIWAIERPWEFQRGFIGPSVWRHFISRFGEESMGLTPDISLNESASREFDKKWSCKIIGGPIIVNHNRTDSDPHGASIFIAVAKAAKEGESADWGSYLSDCIMYEFDDTGVPLSMVTLPRMVDGSRAQVESNAVVWNCQNNATVKLELSAPNIFPPMGPGDFDRLTRIIWYRQFDKYEPKAWLLTDKVEDPVAFASDHFFRVLTGGFVTKPDDPVFNLPISIIDYANGEASQMILHVPLSGVVPEPETNAERVGVNSEAAYHTFGPYFLGITSLEAKGQKLVITIGTEDWNAALTFDPLKK